MEKLATWKSLRNDFSVSQIIDSFFGGLIYATLLYLPIAFALIEMLTVYMYLLTLFVVLIIISLFVYMLAIHYFWWKSLILKKVAEPVILDETSGEMKETWQVTTDIRKLFIKNMFIIDGVILVLGLIFIFVLIPILWI